MRALLFDLDDTLVVQESAEVASFEATARLAAAHHPVDERALAISARSEARELWLAAPTYPYCVRVGISSWEGLWCRFEGDEPHSIWLRSWSPTYRRETWARALALQGVDDMALAEELGDRFALERRSRHEVFGDVLPALIALAESYILAIVTNGASCLQREKLAASELNDYFACVVVSGDLGVGKPDGTIFRFALSRLGVDAGRATMIGDNLARDVDGARAAGLGSVWVNRSHVPRPEGRRGMLEISTLSDLAPIVAALP